MLEEEHLESLVVWAYSKGFAVIFDKKGGDNICFSSKTIEIMESRSLEEKLYILSHECGHILAKKKITHFVNEKQRMVERIIEEIEAWNRAEKLLERLKVPFDLEKFQQMKYDALDKYCKKYPKIS
jgi:Zn-dependent peptidase ImmA (M78 family)